MRRAPWFGEQLVDVGLAVGHAHARHGGDVLGHRVGVAQPGEPAQALLRVDRKSIYESIRRGELPGVVRVGRAIRIGRTALLQWLAGQGRVSRSGATR